MTHPHPRALEAALRASLTSYDASDLLKRTSQGWSVQAALERLMKDAVPAAVTAYLDALQETHALVPREATVGMFRALTHSWPDDLQKGVWLLGSFAEDYRAMIDAAPPAAQEKK